MRVLAGFTARVARRIRAVAGVPYSPGSVLALLRALGPYAAIEFVLPGGSLLALLLWFYRRRFRAASAT